ncbi:MAG: methyltransferase type 11 [Robiginitomaculum sp.]|nr:MAG: methyltransferase type 11 [Robiginitomaculum sp.]
MTQSVEKLENFYNARLGLAAQAMTMRKLKSLWPHLDNKDVLGYGYTLPYLDQYKKSAHRLIQAMPMGQGAVCQPNRRGNASVLVTETGLPFMPSTFDNVLVVHGLEESLALDTLLEELWRVMKPEARIVIVVGNRTGLWARSDKTPFGAGRPFSRSQLNKALKKTGFMPLVRAGSLYTPPLKILCGPKTSSLIETFGETVWPGFSGLVLVEAVKRLYTGRIVKEHKRVLRPNFSGAVGATTKAYQISDILNPPTKKS